MKIYIAGKITGEPIELCKQKFADAAEALFDAGANPTSPFDLGLPEKWTFDQCKETCFNAIDNCTAIYMLSDWRNSPGARVELHYAMQQKLDVFMETEKDIIRIADLVKVGLVG